MPEEQNQSEPVRKVPNAEPPSKGGQEQTISVSAYKSYWPFALAVALIILLMGIMTNPIVLGVGVILTIAAVVGWGLERR